MVFISSNQHCVLKSYFFSNVQDIFHNNDPYNIIYVSSIVRVWEFKKKLCNKVQQQDIFWIITRYCDAYAMPNPTIYCRCFSLSVEVPIQKLPPNQEDTL